jgi:hypothetical protein
VIIDARFNGPPGSANGGRSAGVFAGASGLDSPVEVTLRRPPPLGVPLTVADGRVRTGDGELVAELAGVDPFDVVVPPVPWAEAVAAARAYPGFTDHPFPTCYVCGPARPDRDGLGIFPGRLPDGRTAAPFVAPPDVAPETVWAALDCPGGWAVLGPGRPYVLGRIAVVTDRVPTPGDRCVVTGASTGTSGRKATVVTALYGPDGGRWAYARATWIAV